MATLKFTEEQLATFALMGTHEFVHHVNGNDGPRLTFEIEKNSRGYNWRVTVTGAATVKQGMALTKAAETALRAEYGVSIEEDK